MSDLSIIVTLAPMTTPHPPVGPTLSDWLLEQIKVDEREAAAQHALDCDVWAIRRQRDDDDRALVTSAWCNCQAKQVLRAGASKQLILHLAWLQYHALDDAASKLGWQLMKCLALNYYDRPGSITVLPHGQYTKWHR